MNQEERANSSGDIGPTLEGNPTKLVLEYSNLYPLFVAAIVTALLMGFVALVRIISPQATWDWLPLVIFLVALEGIYATQWLHHPDRRQINRSTYRLAEFIVIALALRLLTWGLTGGVPSWQSWRGYLLSPLSFFDGAFSVYLLSAIFTWERAIHFSDLILHLRLSHAEINYYSLPRQQQVQQFHDRPIDLERPFVFGRFVKSWLNGGFVLAFFTALTTVDLPALNFETGIRSVARLGLRPEILLALLVYFLVGLWLVSQVRMSVLRARWLSDHVDMQPGVLASWRRFSLIALLIIAVLAAFLPIGSTFGIATILQLIVGFGLALMQMGLALLTLFLAWLFTLLGMSQSETDATEVIPTPAATLPPPLQESPLGETPALVAGGFFWLLVAAVAIAALIFFLRDRGYNLNFAFLKHAWHSFAAWLHNLLRGASRQMTVIQDVVSARLRMRRSRKDGRSPWRFIRLNALSPRQQIRYFYLSTVRRADSKGVPRRKSETPSEYAQELKGNWPEASNDIETLTEAFLQARYSHRDFEQKDTTSIKAIWKRVRSALRGRGKQEETPPLQTGDNDDEPEQ